MHQRVLEQARRVRVRVRGRRMLRDCEEMREIQGPSDTALPHNAAGLLDSDPHGKQPMQCTARGAQKTHICVPVADRGNILKYLIHMIFSGHRIKCRVLLSLFLISIISQRLGLGFYKCISVCFNQVVLIGLNLSRS